MKTIITTLPIYDRLAKQCFERAVHAGHDTPYPIVCPRHRLPSFQWLDDADGAGSVSQIELLNNTYTVAIISPATTWASHGDYVGGGSHFTHTGLEISDANNDTSIGVTAHATTDTFSVLNGNTIRVKGTLAVVSVAATFKLGLNTASHAIVAGAIDEIFIATATNAAAFIEIESTGATEYTFTGVTITKSNGFSITSYFTTLPVLAHDYFTYPGDTLKYLLSAGSYYLRITTNNECIYYSDWFKVDCVYENLISSLTSDNLQDFHSTGTIITTAINTTANNEWVYSGVFSVIKGEQIKVYFNYTKNSGAYNIIELYSNSYGTIAAGVTLSAVAIYEITFTATQTKDDVVLLISSPNACDYTMTEILVTREYSEKYLTINFHNDCDFGDFYYHGGFDQSLWIESEAMETLFPQEEEAVKNGEGRIIRTFIRQDKKYIAKTNVMPDYMVDVFNRMKLHDFIELIDLIGDSHYVYNLEVAHEWLYSDKYYARIDLTFDYDEAIVVGGCCNNLI
jgi:hypothetical protein